MIPEAQAAGFSALRNSRRNAATVTGALSASSAARSARH